MFNQNALEINVYMHHVTIKIYDTIEGERKIQPWQRFKRGGGGNIQAGAELCRAQDQLGYPAEAEVWDMTAITNIWLISMEIVFRLFKTSKEKWNLLG